MKVRELLQIEIWSKETSRKILDPIRKILFWFLPSRKTLKRIGIVFGVLVVVLGVIVVVEVSWLTSGERKVASAALAEIDAMQGLVSASSNDFEARDRQAKETVKAAERVAWTSRDKVAAFGLWSYLNETENARDEIEMRAVAQQRNFHRSGNSQELDRKSDDLSTQIKLEYRSTVLKLLR
jgi:hypothetical protein